MAENTVDSNRGDDQIRPMAENTISRVYNVVFTYRSDDQS